MSDTSWVLVAGTGQYELSQPVLWVSRSLGTMLARLGYGLVVGGWSGVDYIVAESFGQEVNNRRCRLSDFMIQVVPSGSDLPRFQGGHVSYVPPGTLEFTESVKYSNAIVLIGGLGGTYGTFQVAKQEQKPVFPIVGTGGDAAQAYHDILSDWPQPLPAGITEEEFRELDLHIGSAADAQRVVDIATDLIASSLVSGQCPRSPSPGTLFISYSHKDRQWLDRLTDKLRPLELRGEISCWADQRINPGDVWLNDIHVAIGRARIAILLVSPNSVKSEFIAQKEIHWLTEAAESNGLRLLWVLVSRCEYQRFPISKFQSVYDPSVPIDELDPATQNEALVKICKAIKGGLVATQRNSAGGNP